MCKYSCHSVIICGSLYELTEKFWDMLLSFPIPCHVKRKPTWRSRVWWLAKLAWYDVTWKPSIRMAYIKVCFFYNGSLISVPGYHHYSFLDQEAYFVTHVCNVTHPQKWLKLLVMPAWCLPNSMSLSVFIVNLLVTNSRASLITHPLWPNLPYLEHRFSNTSGADFTNITCCDYF